MKMMDEENSRSITFFYPARSVGGAQYLILRLALQLSAIQNIKVYLIDFENGFVWSMLKGNKNISLINYNLHDEIYIANGTTLVIFPSYYERLTQFANFQANANLVVWFIQPYLLINLPRFKNLMRFFMPARVSKVRKLLNALSAKNALLFMDEENFRVNREYFKLNFEPDYLPIPTNLKSNFFAKKKKQNFNIAWLGRVSNEKVESIKYLLNDIFRFNARNEMKIRFHVIGDGQAIGLLKKELIKDKNTDVIFKGVLVGGELEAYLFNEIDCTFVMGTSALDTAAYKIPTILLDYSSGKFNHLNCTYKYKWLFETKGFILGEDIKYNPSFNQLSLDDVVMQVNEDEENVIGEKCFIYVGNNHNVQNIASMLISKANTSTFLISESGAYDISYPGIVNKIRHFKVILSK